MKSFIKENGVVISILLIWLFVHFVCLMLAKDMYYSKDIFYPFTENSLRYSYDITEFLVYGLTPIVIFVITKLIRNENN
jgi:hypothetical protein